MKIYETSVNAIMTVDKTYVQASNYDRTQSGIIATESRVLKSYMPENNVLWDTYERNRRLQEFSTDNMGLVGKGRTFLILNDNGILIEYYSGLEVIPVEASFISTMGSNLGDASYYRAKGLDKDDALYVPNGWLNEVTSDNALSAIETMFADRLSRNIEEEVVKPLQNRLNSVLERNKPENVGKVPMHH